MQIPACITPPYIYTKEIEAFSPERLWTQIILWNSHKSSEFYGLQFIPNIAKVDISFLSLNALHGFRRTLWYIRIYFMSKNSTSSYSYCTVFNLTNTALLYFSKAFDHFACPSKISRSERCGVIEIIFSCTYLGLDFQGQRKYFQIEKNIFIIRFRVLKKKFLWKMISNSQESNSQVKPCSKIFVPYHSYSFYILEG